jgi:hypothetical protein
MSEAADQLARNRQAILAYVARRERRHDPREEPAGGAAFAEGEPFPQEEPYGEGGGWFGPVQRAIGAWWRYHPAHMAVDLASPLLRSYARRKPMQLLGIAAAAGAALTLARPWRLISLTTLAVALLKSSQLSSLVMAAMSAADLRKDEDRPR